MFFFFPVCGTFLIQLSNGTKPPLVDLQPGRFLSMVTSTLRLLLAQPSVALIPPALSLSLAPSLYLFFCHSLIKGPIFSPFHHPPFIPSLFLLSSHPCPCLRSCCSFHPTEIPFHISMFLFSSFACPVMEPSGQCQTIFSFFFFFGEMAWVEVELYKEKKKRK